MSENVYMTGNIKVVVQIGDQHAEIDVPLFVFRNDRRQKGSNQPNMRIYTKNNGKLVEVGALWLKRKGNGKKTKSSQ